MPAIVEDKKTLEEQAESNIAPSRVKKFSKWHDGEQLIELS